MGGIVKKNSLCVLWFLTGWRREQLGEGLLHGRSRVGGQCRRCRQEGGGDLRRPSGADFDKW